MHGEILVGANVKMHIYINFMQRTTAVYENTDGQLLMNGCIVAHTFFKKMFLSTFSSEY